VYRSILSPHVTGGLAALLAILVIAFVASVHGASRLADLNAGVARSREVLNAIEVLRSSLREVESTRRAYLLTHESQFLELYLSLTKEAVTDLDRLRQLVGDDPAQRRRIDGISPLLARQLTLVTNAIAPTAAAPAADAARVASDDATIVTEQIRGLVAELEVAEETRLRERERDTNVRTVKVIRGFAAVALVALLLLGAAYYILDRDAAVHAAIIEELRIHARATPDDAPAAHPAHSAPSGGAA